MRTSLIVTLVVLAGCKEKVTAPKATSAPPVISGVSVEAIEGAAAFPFTQADSKVSWVGQKVTGKHEGSFGVFGGIIELVGGDPTKSRVRAELDMTSLSTTPEKLAGHLKSADFFSVQEFPRATFVSTAIAMAGEAHAVTGNLTLHGVTRSITFPAKIVVTDAEVTVSADFSINRKEFGVVYPGKPDDLIADDVALKLELHARKKN